MKALQNIEVNSFENPIPWTPNLCPPEGIVVVRLFSFLGIVVVVVVVDAVVVMVVVVVVPGPKPHVA